MNGSKSVSRKNYPRSLFRNLFDLPYKKDIRWKLHRSAKGSEELVQRLSLLHVLPIHTGCVNCISWNESGNILLSGSDDQNLILTNPFTYKVLTQYRTIHRANIFSAKFLPNCGDSFIISCSGDGSILHTDVNRLPETMDNLFSCHIGTTYEVATIPSDPNVFLSCGEDSTVRSFDLRVKSKCNKPKCTEDVIISCRRAVTALTVNPTLPYQIAIGCADSTVRIYDRRMIQGYTNHLKPVDGYIGPGLEKKSYRITSLNYSSGGDDLLVSYSSQHLYLFGVKGYKEIEYTSEWLTSGSEQEESCPEVPPVRRLRLRGDWSDTGPDARPHSASAASGRETVQGGLIQRMTHVLTRMLSDPATRAALTHTADDPDPNSRPNPPAPQTPPASQDIDFRQMEFFPFNADRNLNSQQVEQDLPNPDLSDDPVATEGSSDIDFRQMEYFHYEGNSSSPQVQEEEEEEEISNVANTENCSSSVAAESSSAPVVETPPVISNVPEISQVVETSDQPQSGRSDMDNVGSSTSQEQPQEEVPSSSYQHDEPSTSQSNDSNLSYLSDELSTMFNGFKQKYGRNPMVNLMYSAEGSTASTISMSVDSQTPAAQAVEPPPADEDVQMDQEEDTIIEPKNQTKPSSGRKNKCVTEESLDDCDQNLKIKKAHVKMKYVGHRNARTMIKEATFWGEDHVMSGSDCGHVFVWERCSGRLVMVLQADHHVVNCLQPHPSLPLLATSGIDYDVKLWAPVAHQNSFDPVFAQELTTRNAIMLEETRDTITVPASFMIRVLACLNQLRRDGDSGDLL